MASGKDGRAPVPAGAVPAGAARDGRASVPAGAVLAGAAQSMGDALIDFLFLFFIFFLKVKAFL